MAAKKHPKGIVVPLVTPLLDTDTLDTAGLEKLIEHVIAGGVAGIFILGTTGESPCLSYRLRREVIERTCRQVRRRVPLFVGLTDTSFVESVQLAGYACDQGVDYGVVAPPYYFKSDPPELTEYFSHLLPQLPIPTFLYNMPSCTKIMIDISTVQAVADHKNMAGLKDSSADLIYFNKLICLFKGREDFGLYIGPEELLAQSVLAGGDGGINGGANMFPKLYVQLYKAAAAGDLAKINQLHKIVMQISMSIYSKGKHSSSYLKGLKCTLKLLGICSDFIAEPFHCFREKEKQQIGEALNSLDYKPWL